MNEVTDRSWLSRVEKHSRWKVRQLCVLFISSIITKCNNNKYLWIDLTKGYCKSLSWTAESPTLSFLRADWLVGFSDVKACTRSWAERHHSRLLRAVLDNSLMGMGFIAYVLIGLSSHKKFAQLEFEEHVTWRKEVVECHNITGANEYLLRVETQRLTRAIRSFPCRC